MSAREIVLASTSRYRRELLGRLGLPFEAVAPPFVEDDRSGRPRDIVETFALGKAESLRQAHPSALIIGSDQGLVAGGRLLGKPGTVEGACRQLAGLVGATHELVTTTCLLDAATGATGLATDVTRLTFRPLTPEAIARYVERDRPLDCAGSFRIESLGIALFERVETTDPTAIVGLGLVGLVDLLSAAGVEVLGR